MRALVIVALAACSNDVDPRVIPGGGVGDGEIDGEVNVHVIDDDDAPIAGATVEVNGQQETTDSKGLVVFSDVEGAQTIAVKASGYRSEVWVGANGANVTIPMTATGVAPDSATLAGTITGWDTITVPTGHVKAAIVLFSHSDAFGDEANDLQTPAMANICIGGAVCSWTLLSRTGSVTVTAAIVDRDGKGTPTDPDDDTQSIIGWAYKTGVTVEDGVNQSGLTLALVEAGNLETMTIDQGTPPAGLSEVTCVPGIEISDDEVVQLPSFVNSDPTMLLAPKRTVFGGTATYRLTAIAQTTSGDMGAQSILLRQGMTTPDLAAGTWLVTPTDVEITRTTAAWSAVSGAALHSAVWGNGQTELLQITVLASKTASVEVPSLVALPTSGTLNARVTAIGADLDPNDFSLEDDSGLIWGASTQPVSIP
ncbi:MAG TPA: carboxypeptidase-like regulatory domain-containing protein [Kofleriaceae bacterium]